MKKKIILLSLFLLIGQIGFGQRRNIQTGKINKKELISIIKKINTQINLFSQIKEAKVKKYVLSNLINDTKVNIVRLDKKKRVLNRKVSLKEYLKGLSKSKRYSIIDAEYIAIDTTSLKVNPINHKLYYEYEDRSINRLSETREESKYRQNDSLKYNYINVITKKRRVYLNRKLYALKNSKIPKVKILSISVEEKNK